MVTELQVFVLVTVNAPNDLRSPVLIIHTGTSTHIRVTVNAA